jgi:endoglucanase
MQHFVKDDGYNVFRLPVGWQYLTYNQSTGVLNETQFSNYNMLVSDCLSTGAYCEIDIHNYARYDGQVSDHASVIITILNDILDYRSRWSKQ